MNNNAELHSGVQSAISAREPEPAASGAYIYECNRCAIKSNQNKMDTGLREREHLLTLKGRYSTGFVLIVFDVSLCFSPVIDLSFDSRFDKILVSYLVMRLTRPSLYTSVPVTNETQDLPGL